MLERYLEKKLKITISDSRWFIGDLKCLDKDLNIILSNTHEFKEYTDKSIIDVRQRLLGLVMIPGQYILSIQGIKEDIDDARVE